VATPVAAVLRPASRSPATGRYRAALARSTLFRSAALAVLPALLVASCGDGEGGGDAGSTSSTSAEPVSTATPVAGEAAESGGAYVAPALHASDWDAPDVPLPDVAFPYGRSPEPTADPEFYDVTTMDPAEVAAAEPGTVLRTEAVELTGPLSGASGTRLLYRSTDVDGSPAVVSGIVLVPEGPAPEEGRTVVAWAHGTTGIADRCAPSATGNLFYDDYGQVGRDLLDAGYVVAATDYHGLGTPGVHTYHRSEEMARATIDSVVAAHDLADGGTVDVGPLTSQWLVLGHSEGGLAALATDARAALHPYDLDYRGAIVAAPTPPLGTFAPFMFEIEGRGYAVMLLAAVAGVAPDLDPQVALGPEAAGREALLTHGCWEEAVPGFDDIDPADMLATPDVGQRLADVLSGWAAYDPGTVGGPMLVVQGEDDPDVLPPITSQLVADLCGHSAEVEYRTYPGAGHDEVMAASIEDVTTWVAARLAGDEAPSSCGAA
jgi:alpha-beta hydrolase superfamily lysophospholipase